MDDRLLYSDRDLDRYDPAFPEKAIYALPTHLSRQMAIMSIEGWRFHCSTLTTASNRWWNVFDPEGKLVQTHGGLHLEDVVRRAWETRVRCHISEADAAFTVAVKGKGNFYA